MLIKVSKERDQFNLGHLMFSLLFIGDAVSEWVSEYMYYRKSTVDEF